MHTIKGISALTASIIASAANGGGTYMTVASGFNPSAASLTVLNTGKPKCNVPPFLGVTPQPSSFHTRLPVDYEMFLAFQ